MIRCAFFEMKRLPSRTTPRWTSDSISSMSEPGSTTTPQPMTHRHPGWRMPEGIEWSTYFSRPTTTVWPALLPPWYRTTTFTCGASTSTTLPLPSSPHWVPTTTMLGMAGLPPRPHQLLGRLQRRPDLQHALGAVGEIHHQHLARARARAADDEGSGHALGPRARQRLLQTAADDVARDRDSQIAQAPRQRQRRRLLAREVDDEEVRARQLDGHPLRFHDTERPGHVEGEAHGRAVVAEAAEHLVVAATGGHRGAEVGHGGLEVGAGVVGEAPGLAQIEQHGLGQPVDRQQPMDLGEVGQGPLRARVAGEGRRPLQHLLAAEERSEEHTSELQSLAYLVCRLLLEKKKEISYLVSMQISISSLQTHNVNR